MTGKNYARALTIAGSDSGGGAGIQADLKTFTALGVYGASAITALTAQNTQGVHGVHLVPADFVRRQIDVVVSDIGVDAAKTGMLVNAQIVEAVADAARENEIANLVVDPVMISKHGARLLEADAIEALTTRLLPLATVVTPNAHEAALLAKRTVETWDEMREAAKAILGLGCRSVMVKGGHAGNADEAVDYWTDGTNELRLPAPRSDVVHTHGTGCTLSAALAAHLAMGETLMEAVRAARRFITGAIQSARPLGQGVGPVNHMWAQERPHGSS